MKGYKVFSSILHLMFTDVVLEFLVRLLFIFFFLTDSLILSCCNMKVGWYWWGNNLCRSYHTKPTKWNVRIQILYRLWFHETVWSTSLTMLYFCIGCRISVAHMDSPSIVEVGLTQMLSSVLDQNSDTILDVFFSLQFVAVLSFIFNISSWNILINFIFFESFS